MKNKTFLLIMVILLGCDNKYTAYRKSIQNKSLDQSTLEYKKADINLSFKEADLLNTSWILQVFAEVPACIDTITFLNSGIGQYYSCERELINSLGYRVIADTLFIDQYELTSQVDASKGEIVTTKYKLIKRNDSLKMVSIQHKNGNGFQEVDGKYLTGKTFNQLK